MLTTMIAGAMLAGPVGGEFEVGILKMVDRGRLTPFGRTYDIYLDTDGRQPSFLHAGRTWINDPDNTLGPLETRGKENKDALISLENFSGKDVLWFNGNNPLAPNADIRTVPGMDDWYWNHDPDWWACQLGNHLNTSHFNKEIPIEWYKDSIGFPQRRWDSNALQYFWADSWLLQGEPGVHVDHNGQPIFPITEEQWAGWMYQGANSSSASIGKPAIDEITDWVDCDSTPASRDSGILLRFGSSEVDWSSNEFPGQYRIMRVTGPIERVSFNFYVTYTDLDQDNRQDYVYTTIQIGEDLNPTDLNEDGATDFGDLLIVLGDMGAGKYKSDGFRALTTVLSGWGPNQ